MKNFKKILMFIVLFLLQLCLMQSFADDGSWNKAFSLSGGSIYAEEDDDFIVLEKELLVFNGVYTEAVFLFSNTSSRHISLDCGFPVVHRINVWRNNGYYEIPAGKYGGADVPGLGFFETMPHPGLSGDEPVFAAAEVILDNENNLRREVVEKHQAAEIGLEFQIFQDEKEVPVDEILLERELNKNSAGLNFHFRHRLEFPAGSSTVVRVRYSQDLLYGNDGGAAADVFRWSYIIGTGGTWKGPIGEFYFIKPSAWDGEPSGMQRISRRQQGGVDIYHAADYEPDRRQEFDLSSRPVGMMKEWEFYDSFPERKKRWIEKVLIFSEATEPVQDFVTGVGSSSSISDRVDVFSDEGVVEGASFTAMSAFDGLPETSWCEGAAGYGKGEYLEFRLTEPAAGLIVRNGFKRFTIDDWVFETGAFKSSVRDDLNGIKDYFSMNGRVRKLEVLNSDGSHCAALSLDDIRDPQAFFGLNLLPGRYRLVIGDIYEGSRWKDTCLAELTFIQLSEGGAAEKLFTDSFYKEALGIRKF